MQIKEMWWLTGWLNEIRIDMNLRTPAQKVQQNRYPLAAICRMEYPLIPGKPTLGNPHPSPGLIPLRRQHMNAGFVFSRAQCCN